jgi:hypothetical protein
MAQSEGQPITVCCYPVDTSDYTIYEDDGRSLDYEQGVYTLSRIESRMDASDSKWTLTISKPDCPVQDKKGRARFTPAIHTYCVEAYLDAKPASVMVNGRTLTDWKWDETLRLLRFDTGLDNTQDITVTVNIP